MTAPAATERDAISAALNQDWKEAIRINNQLLKADKNNINVLNRLGFAYLQSGELTQAKKIFTKVSKLDSYNQIAIKNLKKLGVVRQKDLRKTKTTRMSPMLFLEEPGKTKIVECVNCAPLVTLSSVMPGQYVELRARNHTVEIRDDNSVYLAALPDDLSFRMIKFLAGGNAYTTVVQSVGKNSLVLFIRETARGKRFVNQPSFASTGIYIPYGKADHGEEESPLSADADSTDDKEE